MLKTMPLLAESFPAFSPVENNAPLHVETDGGLPRSAKCYFSPCAWESCRRFALLKPMPPRGAGRMDEMTIKTYSDAAMFCRYANGAARDMGSLVRVCPDYYEKILHFTVVECDDMDQARIEIISLCMANGMPLDDWGIFACECIGTRMYHFGMKY